MFLFTIVDGVFIGQGVGLNGVGAAIATGVSQTLALLIVLTHYLSNSRGSFISASRR